MKSQEFHASWIACLSYSYPSNAGVRDPIGFVRCCIGLRNAFTCVNQDHNGTGEDMHLRRPTEAAGGYHTGFYSGGGIVLVRLAADNAIGPAGGCRQGSGRRTLHNELTFV